MAFFPFQCATFCSVFSNVSSVRNVFLKNLPLSLAIRNGFVIQCDIAFIYTDLSWFTCMSFLYFIVASISYSISNSDCALCHSAWWMVHAVRLNAHAFVKNFIFIHNILIFHISHSAFRIYVHRTYYQNIYTVHKSNMNKVKITRIISCLLEWFSFVFPFIPFFFYEIEPRTMEERKKKYWELSNNLALKIKVLRTCWNSLREWKENFLCILQFSNVQRKHTSYAFL